VTQFRPIQLLQELGAVSTLVALVLLPVSMLPQIDTEHRRALRLSNTVHQRVVLVVRLSDYQVGL